MKLMFEFGLGVYVSVLAWWGWRGRWGVDVGFVYVCLTFLRPPASERCNIGLKPHWLSGLK